MIGRESRPPDELASDAYVVLADRATLDPFLAEVPAYDGGGRYYLPVFGRRDTRSFDLAVRADVAFRPTLTLQFFSQLFTARGHFDRFSLLTGPDVQVPLPTYPKQDVFRYNSFLTNAVLRWEYRPGSNLYLVWSQNRALQDELDPLHPGRPGRYDDPTRAQLADTFRLFPTDVLMVKLSYLFMP